MDYRRLALVLLGIMAFGAAKLSFGRDLTRDLRGAHFFQSQLNLDVREQTGQMGFVAALSGVRAPLADLIWAQTYDAFAETDWGRLKILMDAATTLQPRTLLFWDNASWHMAYNASVNALQNPRQPKEVLRLRASREYIRLGEEYLLRGIGFNPDRAKLFDVLGMLYKQKMGDHRRAAWAYFEGAKRADALSYVYRNGIYELAKCPGYEQETLRLLREVYRSPEQRTPSILVLLKEFQEKLNVPPAERIDVSKDLEEAMPRRPQRP